MAERRDPSHPPSHPHPVTRADRGGFAAQDRPARLQLAAALVLGVVLAASGLYLWRRTADGDGDGQGHGDTTAAEALSASAAADLAVIVDAGPATGPDAGGTGAVLLSEARVLACHDRGPKKTPPDQCDRLTPIEQALSSAIQQSASCVPVGATGSTIEYVADVSFLRHKLSVTLPHTGRTLRDHKVLSACSTAVRGAMQGLELDGVDHQHARYKIAVKATYRGSAGGS